MQNKENEDPGEFQRLSDKKLLKGLVICVVILIYAFIFLKIVFLK